MLHSQVSLLILHIAYVADHHHCCTDFFWPDVDMQFCCFPKIDISHYSEDLLEWIFFKFSLVENLKKIVIFWVYCTALLLTSPKMGKARRRTHSICVPLEEQISCQPNLWQYKYAISARVHYFTQRHTLRSRGKYRWDISSEKYFQSI